MTRCDSASARPGLRSVLGARLRAALGAGVCALALAAAAHADPLVDAARAGDGAAALGLIGSGADVNAAAPDGTTALHWAAHTGDLELARRLLAKGADPKAVNYYGGTPLQEAAIRGDAAMIGLLIDAGADPDETNRDGQTPLMIVARTANVDAAELLIARGADVNKIEQWKGQTALMWASAQKQPQMVRLLLAHGADPNVRSNLNHHEREITAEPRYLWRPPGGLTALIYAARQGCADCARALVEAGAEIDEGDPEGATALLTASMNFNFDTASYLIDAGANVNKWDWRGRNPLYAAVDLATLPHGGRPDQPSTDETTAHQLAAKLLEHGANPNLQLKLNPGYRHTKDDRGSDSMLHNYGATPLLRAGKGMDVESIRLLLAHGALVDLPNERGMTPLMAAAGMDSRVADTRGYFDTADVQQRSIAALTALLEGGADIEKKDGQGRTAVFAAAAWGWNDVLTFLVEKGARLDVKDANGKTPADAARGPRGAAHPDTVALIEKLAAAQGPSTEKDPA